MACTISTGINTSAVLFVLLPLAVISVSCRAECLNTESWPGQQSVLEEGVAHTAALSKHASAITLAIFQVALISVSCGAECIILSQRSVAKEPHGTVPFSQVRTPVAFWLRPVIFDSTISTSRFWRWCFLTCLMSSLSALGWGDLSDMNSLQRAGCGRA